MTILNYLRKFMKKREPKPALTYIREPRVRSIADEPRSVHPVQVREIENEIDLSHRTDLEDYARGLTVSKASIERWISSGLLMPEELKVAEKLVKIMNKN